MHLVGQVQTWIQTRRNAFEAGRSDADNGNERLPHPNRLSDNRGIGCEALCPEVITQDGGPTMGGPPANIIIGFDQPAEIGLDAKNGKSISADESDV